MLSHNDNAVNIDEQLEKGVIGIPHNDSPIVVMSNKDNELYLLSMQHNRFGSIILYADNGVVYVIKPTPLISQWAKEQLEKGANR